MQHGYGFLKPDFSKYNDYANQNLTISISMESTIIPINIYEERYVTIKDTPISVPSVLSYLLDILLYSAILLISTLWEPILPPRVTSFSTMDYSLWYPYIPEFDTYAPIWFLFILSVVLPIFVLAVVGLFVTQLPIIRKIWDISIIYLTLLGAFSCQLFIVCIIKNSTGRPRPDFIDRCVPISFEESSVANVGELSTILICSNPDLRLVYEGMRSFPSGHASSIFCAMTIQCLFCASKFNVFDGRGLSIKIVFTFLFPYSIAWMVAASRVSDNRHRIADVLAGSGIGTFMAILFYSFYFPIPWKLENLGRAYPPRRFGVTELFNGVGGFWKIPGSNGAYEERVEGTDILPTTSSNNPVKRERKNANNNRRKYNTFSASDLQDLGRNL